MDRTGFFLRTALLLLYTLEVGVLAPLHLLTEIEAHPSVGPTVSATCSDDAPCPHPGHHHGGEPSPHQCPVCATASRAAELAASPVPLAPPLNRIQVVSLAAGVRFVAEPALDASPRAPPPLLAA